MTEINIYVKAIDTSPHYEFYTDSVGTTELTPTNTLYTNNTYIFNRLNNETSHPFFISDVGYEQESTSAITIIVDSFSSGSVDYLNGIKNISYAYSNQYRHIFLKQNYIKLSTSNINTMNS